MRGGLFCLCPPCPFGQMPSRAELPPSSAISRGSELSSQMQPLVLGTAPSRGPADWHAVFSRRARQQELPGPSSLAYPDGPLSRRGRLASGRGARGPRSCRLSESRGASKSAASRGGARSRGVRRGTLCGRGRGCHRRCFSDAPGSAARPRSVFLPCACPIWPNGQAANERESGK